MLGPGVSARGQKTIVIRPDGDYQTGDSLFGGIFGKYSPLIHLKKGKKTEPRKGRREARKGCAARAGILSGVSPGGFANCSDQDARGAT